MTGRARQHMLNALEMKPDIKVDGAREEDAEEQVRWMHVV